MSLTVCVRYGNYGPLAILHVGEFAAEKYATGSPRKIGRVGLASPVDEMTLPARRCTRLACPKLPEPEAQGAAPGNQSTVLVLRLISVSV